MKLEHVKTIIRNLKRSKIIELIFQSPKFSANLWFFPHCQHSYAQQSGIQLVDRRGKCDIRTKRNKNNNNVKKNSTLRNAITPTIFHIHSEHLIGSWCDKSAVYHLHSHLHLNVACNPCLAKVSIKPVTYIIGSVASDV